MERKRMRIAVVVMLALVLCVTALPTPVQAASTYTAKRIVSTFLVDGESYTVEGYNINNKKYYDIRDLATLLNHSGKCFNLYEDSIRKQMYTIWTKNVYRNTNGKELKMKNSKVTSKKVSAIRNKLRDKRDKRLSYKGYIIGGVHYYGLHDIMKYVNVSVSENAAEGAIVLRTEKSYGSVKNPAIAGVPLSKRFESVTTVTPGKSYYISTNNDARKAVAPEGDAYGNGSRAIVEAKYPDLFLLQKSETEGLYTLQSGYSKDSRITVSANQHKEGNSIIYWQNTNGESQRFKFQATGNRVYMVSAKGWYVKKSKGALILTKSKSKATKFYLMTPKAEFADSMPGDTVVKARGIALGDSASKVTAMYGSPMEILTDSFSKGGEVQTYVYAYNYRNYMTVQFTNGKVITVTVMGPTNITNGGTVSVRKYFDNKYHKSNYCFKIADKSLDLGIPKSSSPTSRLMFHGTNAIRVMDNRHSLTQMPQLDKAAQFMSEDMLKYHYVGHVSSDGRELGKRMQDYKVGGFLDLIGTSGGENSLGMGVGTDLNADFAINVWYNSSKHRNWVLNSRFTHIGNGVAYGIDNYGRQEGYATQDFFRHQIYQTADIYN